MTRLPENFSLITIAEGIRTGAFSAESIAAAVIERCTRKSELGTLIFQDREALLASARDADAVLSERPSSIGPLHGVPILIKDNIDVRGMPCSAGTAALEHDHPDADATAVSRLRAAGALIAGKANLYELAVGGTGRNLHFGRAANPWRLEYTTGGSSSGSAAAVAARLVPGSLGTDTAGSVRMPGSFCGTAGFRPSFHRYPGDGIIPHSTTRDSIGVIANSVADLAVLDGVVADEIWSLDTPDLNGVRIGRPRGAFYEALDERTADMMDFVAGILAEQGAIIVDADIPGLHELTPKCAWPISAYEVARDLPGALTQRKSGVTIEDILAGISSPVVKERFNPLAISLDKLEARYQVAMNEDRPRLQKILYEYFSHHKLAAFMYPTTPFPTAAVDDDDADIEINGKQVRHGFGYAINNLLYQTATGVPSLTVPAGLTPDKLPVGVSFDGPTGSDQRLLAIGYAFEQARGPFPLPPHSA